MNTSRLVLALTVLNVAVLALTVGPSRTPAVGDVLRARALELVDDHDQVRAQLHVEASGEVVFRLKDADGTIRVKLGASESGSGLLLLDEETTPAIHMIARRTGTDERPTTTSIRLRSGQGVERVFVPEGS